MGPVRNLGDPKAAGRRCRVAVIAPYADLMLEARAAVEELGIDVTVEEGDLAEGVRAARRAVDGGAEVIISRGGTALQICRALPVPVVEIRVSPYDILRCLPERGLRLRKPRQPARDEDPPGRRRIRG